jgi:hypothetical protein
MKTDLQNTAEQHVAKVARDISDTSHTWRKIGNACEALAQLLVLAQIPVSFVAGRGNVALSNVSAAMGVASLALLGFSKYATSESSERTEQFNRILRAQGISEVPNITADGGVDVKV